jgi:hypothetical protein
VRTGGTADHPAGLYPPGTGTCPHCGQQQISTYAGGRLGAHGTAPRILATNIGYQVRTCTGWGQAANNWKAVPL